MDENQEYPVSDDTAERPSLKRVAIVGRPNVGKSALFNRLARRRISIVHDEPGVTRDRISALCPRGPVPFEITDTGGIGAGVDADFSEIVATQAEIAMGSADLILFTVDAQDGLTPVDEILADKLRRGAQPVILVVNKIDHPRHDALEIDFTALGFANIVRMSAAHGRGESDLLEMIGDLLQLEVDTTASGRLEEDTEDEEEQQQQDGAQRATRIAIVGRPNVGKSSLINALVNDERTIVSEIAGTTRDAVDIEFRLHDREYVLIDTAGIRSRKRRKSSVEVFSAMRSERSIRRADLVILVIDGAEGPTAQDQKIAGVIKEEAKPCLIVCNKFDLIRNEMPFHELVEELQGIVSRELHFIDYARTIFLSALHKKRIENLLKAIEMVELESQQRIGTGILNRLFDEAIQQNAPPSIKGRRFKVLYATHVKPRRPRPINPAEFLLFCNDPTLLTPQYERYLERKLREKYHFRGLPVLFRLRGRETKSARKNKAR